MKSRTRRFAPAAARRLAWGRWLGIAYGVAAILWAMGCVLHGAFALNCRLRGQMPTLTLTTRELTMTSYIPLSEADPAWQISTDGDPHLFWQGEAYVETVRLHAEYGLPPGAVALYYLRPGQQEYSERQKVFARVSAAGEYTFDLGGRRVSGLRIDPDSRGGVPTRLVDIQLNPPTPWYLSLLPGAGACLLLLFVPPLAAALAALLLRRS